MIMNTGDNTYVSLTSLDGVGISNAKYSKALKYLIAFEIRMYKLSAGKTYQYVIDLEPELIHVCILAIGAVNM